MFVQSYNPVYCALSPSPSPSLVCTSRIHPLVRSGQQRNHLFVNGGLAYFVLCLSALNDISTRWCFCNNRSTTRTLAHLIISPGFVRYFSSETRRWLWLGNDKVWVAGLPQISFPLISWGLSQRTWDRFEKKCVKKNFNSSTKRSKMLIYEQKGVLFLAIFLHLPIMSLGIKIYYFFLHLYILRYLPGIEWWLLT